MTALDHPGTDRARRGLIALQLAALYVLPVLLFVTEAVPASWRFWVFGIGMSVPLLEMLLRRWSPRQIGLRTDTLAAYFLPYAVFTVTVTAGLLLLAQLLGKVPTGHALTGWNPSLIAAIVLLSFLQELCFRGYLVAKLNQVFDNTILKIVANAGLFAWMHAIYPDPLFSVAITFLAGLGFAGTFHCYPNMWLIAGSHAVLNSVSTLYCFLSLAGACAR